MLFHFYYLQLKVKHFNYNNNHNNTYDKTFLHALNDRNCMKLSEQQVIWSVRKFLYEVVWSVFLVYEGQPFKKGPFWISWSPIKTFKTIDIR